MKNKLFSVIILCYRHFEYLYSAIDSVLSQDYDNIQLIISDDASPNFPRTEIEQYIQKQKQDNLTDVIVRQQERNSGTVRHMNHAVKAASGEYIVVLAGDDNLYDEHVLTKYVQGFEQAPENCWIEMAETGMYDETLEHLERYYTTPIVRNALKETVRDTTPLLKLLIQNGACLPSTSTCFKKEFFVRFGDFDEHYVLVEDYPTHVRLAEEGWIIHYSNFIAIKHRHGGISHGQQDKLPRSVFLYLTDIKQMYEEIILTKIHILSETEQNNVSCRIKQELRWVNFKLSEADQSLASKVKVAVQYPAFSLLVALRKAWVWSYKKHVDQLKLCLWMWALLPSIIGMIDSVVPRISSWTTPVLYFLAGICGVLWIIAFFIWALNKILWTVERFPNETLAIG